MGNKNPRIPEREIQTLEHVLAVVRDKFREATPDRSDIYGRNIIRAELTTATLEGAQANARWDNIKTVSASVSGRTDYGGQNSKYKINEDSILLSIDGDSLVAGVLDGAGGSKAGRSASILVNAEVSERCRYKQPELIEIFDGASIEIEDRVPGAYATGVIVQILADDTVNLLASGDSKVMTIRGGKKLNEGTTKMQNVVQEAIDAGYFDAHVYYTHEANNVITGAFGRPREKRPKPISFKAETGDQYILASDGVWDVVSEYEIIELSKRHRGTELQKQIFGLAYNRNNSRVPFTIQFDADRTIAMQPFYSEGEGYGDNISVIVIDKKERGDSPQYAIGDYVTIELPDEHDTVDHNWRIAGSIKTLEDGRENYIPVEKQIGGESRRLTVPLEQMERLNRTGSHRFVTFDHVNTQEELADAIINAGSVRGSTQTYSAVDLLGLMSNISTAKAAGETNRMQTLLSFATNGQPGQNLYDAAKRIFQIPANR